jgi:hypothetical protein
MATKVLQGLSTLTNKLPTKCSRKVIGKNIYERVVCGKKVMPGTLVCPRHSANPDDWPQSLKDYYKMERKRQLGQ